MAQDPAERAEQVTGGVLPDFTLSLVGDPARSWTLHEEASKRTGTLVVFWSAVCSHCLRYDSYLNGFAERHPELSFVAVASRQGEGVSDIQAAIASRGLTFPVLHDPDRRVAHLLHVQQTPRVFLADRLARLHYRGAIDNFKYPEDSQYEPYLEPAVASLLAGHPAARAETPSFGCAVETVYYSIPKPLKFGPR